MCDYYISQFLEQVHSTHWFYSIDVFLNRVDRTYSAGFTDSSSSWICSLYAIFALGSSSQSENRQQDEKSSIDYIAMAKNLIPSVYDEADIDSIRALAILVRGSK
jgi:aldehyde dehydrogenase (NAD+)